MKKVSLLATAIFSVLLFANFASATSPVGWESQKCNKLNPSMICKPNFDVYGPDVDCQPGIAAVASCPGDLAHIPAWTKTFDCSNGCGFSPPPSPGYTYVPVPPSCPTEKLSDGRTLGVLKTVTDNSNLARMIACSVPAAVPVYNFFNSLAFGPDGSISNLATGFNPVMINDSDGLFVNVDKTTLAPLPGQTSVAVLGARGLGGDPNSGIAVAGISTNDKISAGLFENRALGTMVKLALNSTSDHGLEVNGTIASGTRPIPASGLPAGVMTAAKCTAAGGTVTGVAPNQTCETMPLILNSDAGLRLLNSMNNVENFRVDVNGTISNPGVTNSGAVKFDDGILANYAILTPIGPGGMTIDTNTTGGGVGGFTILTKSGGETIDAYGTGGFNFAATRGAFENNGSKVGRPGENYPVRVSDLDGLSVNGKLQNTWQFPKLAEFTATGNNVLPFGSQVNWTNMCSGSGGTPNAYDGGGDNKYCEYPLQTKKDLIVNGNLTVTGSFSGGGTYTTVLGNWGIPANVGNGAILRVSCPDSSYTLISCTYNSTSNNQVPLAGIYEDSLWSVGGAPECNFKMAGAAQLYFNAKCFKP